jgi:hypothetical protein
VRAVFVEDAEPAFRVAEHHEVLAEQAHAQRRAVGFGDFLGQARRDPVAAHDLAHRGIAHHTAQEIVFFRSHGVPRQARVFASVTHLRYLGLVKLRNAVELGQ